MMNDKETFVQIFEKRVIENPHKIAIVDNHKQLTYKELNESANFLANKILKNKHTNKVIAIMMSRSVECVIAIIGIVKSGNSYVFLEPDSPEERVKFILKEASIKFLIIDNQNLCKKYNQISFILLNEKEKLKQTNENKPIKLGEVAYIVYTSGTSGLPKGVIIEHSNVLNYFFGITEQISFDNCNSFAHLTTFAADLSNTMLFVSLLRGCCLHILTNEVTLNPELLFQYINKNNIDCYKSVPSHLSLLSDYSDENFLPKKVLIIGGEKLTTSLVQKLKSINNSNCKFYNHYGPSETCIGVLSYEINDIQKDEMFIPIGKPIKNVRCYVLDNNYKHVPINFPGELYIAGNSLGKGYFKNESLTKSKFLKNIIKKEDVIYRTGDIVKVLPTGNIEFLHRKDNQVKINGFRIELDEIENRLKKHPKIQDVIINRVTSKNQLIAFIKPHKKYIALFESSDNQYKLPNNIIINHINKNETDYLFKEIFEIQAYNKHGIYLENDDVVFDVGSNIGLFSLYSYGLNKNIKVHAFEPNPIAYKKLNSNLERYNINFKSYNIGLSSKEEFKEFVFYDNFSILSGYYINENNDKSVVENYVKNQNLTTSVKKETLNENISNILDYRFNKKQTIKTKLKTISSILKTNKINKISLLKINVEKSELDVLKGIEDQDWIKIKQVILEIDTESNFKIVLKLLESKNFKCYVEKDILLDGTKLCYIFGFSNHYSFTKKLNFKWDNYINQNEIEKYLKKYLPVYMLPSNYIFLRDFPLNSNKKIDRNKLNIIYKEFETPLIAPKNDIEKLLFKIIIEVLKIHKISIYDNFFIYGMDSIKVIVLRMKLIEKNINLDIQEFFKNNTIALLAERIIESNINNVIKEDQKLLNIQNNNELEYYPVTGFQFRIWILSQFKNTSKSYHIPTGVRFKGYFKPDLFLESINYLINRHDIFRTTFVELFNGELVQKINSKLDLPIEIKYYEFNSSDLKSIERTKKDILKPFNLAKGPLFRACLIRTDTDDFSFFMNLHHIISDGWSMNLLIEDLSKILYAKHNNLKIGLPQIKYQYKDYSIWLDKELKSNSLKKEKKYWLDKFKEEVKPLNLPSYKPRPNVQTFKGKEIYFSINSKLYKKLKLFTLNNEGTIFTCLLTVFNAILFKYTEQSDIIIGTPVSGREHSDFLNIVGPFINTLPIRTNVMDDDNFLSLHNKVKQNVFEGISNSKLPFEELIKLVRFKKEISRNPLFDVMIAYHDSEQKNLTSYSNKKRADFQIINFEKKYSLFDLTMTFVNNNNNIEGAIEYNTELFSNDFINRMIKHYCCFLEKLLDQQTTLINKLSYISENEKNEIYNLGINKKTIQIKPINSLIEQWNEQVKRFSNKCCIIFENQELSYTDIDIKSNQLANYILEKTNKTKTKIIGIELSRGIWPIISLFSIIKLGKTYLPIDTNFPDNRKEFIINDSKCTYVLNNIEIEKFNKNITQYSEKLEPNNVLINDIAYIIFTSGSTGVPKGVMIKYNSMIDYIQTFTEYFNINEKDRVIHQSSLSFDTHVEEIFPTLLNGATLLISSISGSDIDELINLIEDSKATIISTTPLVISQFNKMGVNFESLRYIISGGDVLKPSYISNLIKSNVIVNTYGPTESTVCATYNTIKSIKDAPLLGKPIRNRIIYILDKKQNVVGKGVAGEICIAGEGLFVGYCSSKKQTTQFLEEIQDTVYKTGDIGKWTEDNNLQYLGRRDSQIKIRGYRVELMEIELQLSKYPEIDELITITIQNENKEYKIVVFYSFKKEISISDFKMFSMKLLPHYMMPNLFIELDTFPLNSNGKIDRIQLIKQAQEYNSEEFNFISPKGKIECFLVKTISELLNIEENKINIENNFFDLGVNSIHIVKLKKLLENEFNLDIEIVKFFEFPSIRSFALKYTNNDKIVSSNIKDKNFITTDEISKLFD